MQPIKMNKQELIKILTQNKEEHIQTFEEAWEAYTEKLTQNLERMLEAAKTGDPAEVPLHINLVKPTNHADDYDRALRMLNHDLDDTVKLDEREYANLVDDEWGWVGEVSNYYFANTGKPHPKFG